MMSLYGLSEYSESIGMCVLPFCHDILLAAVYEW